MTYNIVLVSGIQQNNSVIHISTSIPFFRFFSQIHYYRRLNKVPCAVQYILVDYKPSFFSVWTFSIIFFEVIYNSFISVCPLKLSFQVLCVHSKLGIVEHIIRIVAKMWIRERRLKNLLSCGISEILKLLQHKMFQDLTHIHKMYLLGYVPPVVGVCFQLREMSSLLFV